MQTFEKNSLRNALPAEKSVTGLIGTLEATANVEFSKRYSKLLTYVTEAGGAPISNQSETPEIQYRR